MRSEVVEKIEEGVRKATEVVTPASGTTTAVGSITGWLNEYGVVMGLAFTLVSLLMNHYFRTRADRRQQRAAEREEIEHRARMANLKKK